MLQEEISQYQVVQNYEGVKVQPVDRKDQSYYSPVKAIVNISKRLLTTCEKSVLNNQGFKFVKIIKQIPNLDLIA